MSFYLTAPRTTAAFHQYYGVFSNAEINRLTDYIKTRETEPALLAQGKTNEKVRRSRISFLPTTTDTKWLYNRLSEFAKEVNRRHFNFDLTALQHIQYTEYDASDLGTYHDHLDWSPGVVMARKLSIVIQLTDGTEYDGGDLQLKLSSSEPFTASRTKGDAVIFPSWILHGVTPVTRGLRKSLVVWVEGPEWK